MSEYETVYATSLSGYFYVKKASDDPSIVQAKERNKHLDFIRCNEIYKGKSFFKSKKEQEYYERYCQSLQTRRKTKSHIFKSQITNISSIPEEQPLNKLYQLSAKTKNRPTLFESHHEEREGGTKSRRISQLIGQQNKVIEYEQKCKTSKKHLDKQGIQVYSSQTFVKEDQDTPKFSQRKFDFSQFGNHQSIIFESKKYNSDKKPTYSDINPEVTSQQMPKPRETSPHSHQQPYIPHRPSQKKMSSSGMNFECLTEIERLRKQLSEKNKEIEHYKKSLSEKNKNQTYLLKELMEQKKGTKKVQEVQKVEKSKVETSAQEISSELKTKDERLIYFVFMLMLMVKSNMQQ